MKKYMFKTALIAIVMFTSMAVSAQRGQRPDPKEQAKKTVETWKKAFNLNEDQQTKAYNVLLAASEKRMKTFQELRNNGGGRDEMMKAFTKMQENTDKELKKIFTDDQWTKYEKWKKDNMQRRRGRSRN